MEESVCAFFAHTANDGKIYNVKYYNLDVVISVGYRVKSKRGCAFEIKLGLSKAEEGANNLIKACDDIVANGGRAPLIKCVIYGVGNIAYQNDKAIYILPITALED